MSTVYMYSSTYRREHINSNQTCVDWIVVLWHEQSRVTADKFGYHGNVPKQFIWKPLWSRYQLWYWQRLQVRQLLVLKFLFHKNEHILFKSTKYTCILKNLHKENIMREKLNTCTMFFAQKTPPNPTYHLSIFFFLSCIKMQWAAPHTVYQ